MRLKWFKKLRPPVQTLVLSGLIFFLVVFYISISKYIQPAITSLLSLPLRLCEDLSSGAKQFLSFQDLSAENKRLTAQINQLTGQLIQLEDITQENQRLRGLLVLPQRESFQTCAALLIGKDSSNWTKALLINRGSLSGIQEGMPVISGLNLVGRVIQVGPSASKVLSILDINSKIAAKILRTREEGLVYGAFEPGKNTCKMKYVQQVEVGDEVVSSGLGGIYPKGLLIGEVVAVLEGQDNLYQIAQILPAADITTLEEVLVVTGR